MVGNNCMVCLLLDSASWYVVFPDSFNCQKQLLVKMHKYLEISFQGKLWFLPLLWLSIILSGSSCSSGAEDETFCCPEILGMPCSPTLLGLRKQKRVQLMIRALSRSFAVATKVKSKLLSLLFISFSFYLQPEELAVWTWDRCLCRRSVLLWAVVPALRSQLSVHRPSYLLAPAQALFTFAAFPAGTLQDTCGCCYGVLLLSEAALTYNNWL